MIRPTLKEWRAKLQAVEKPIPWDPRPLKRGDHLVGREQKIQQFVDTLEFTPCVLLSAASGAGKSSLLEAGLVPRLWKDRRVPIVCSRWTRPGSTIAELEHFLLEQAVAYLREANEDELADAAAAPTDSNRPFTSFVSEHIPRSAVVVLDQFEELIRLNRPSFELVLKWVQEATSKHHIRVVISLRLEYLYELRSFEKKMAPKSVKHIELEPITSVDAVRDIINLGRAGQPVAEVTDELREMVVQEWERERNAPRSGLLGLQALLYSLYWTMVLSPTTSGQIDGAVIRQFVESVNRGARSEQRAPSHPDDEGGSPSRNLSLFESALPAAAEMKIETCLQAFRSSLRESADPYLELGTAQLVREATQHLDSGGFKLHREVWELARKCLDRELELLGPDSRSDRAAFISEARNIFTAMAKATGTLGESGTAAQQPHVDLLEDSNVSIVGAVVGQRLIAGQPWQLDSRDVTSGPLLGLSPAQVLVEEYRRFLFAIKWLEESSLVRITAASTDDEWVVSLIHDGFGKALASWADSYPRRPRAELTRITGSRGQTFRWDDPPGTHPWPEVDDAVVVNVRWRDCEVSELWVRRTRFVNCDFRGTRFTGCTFEGAVFVNCLLDGAAFSGCTIVGGAGEYGEYHGKDTGTPHLLLAPSFEIPTETRPGLTPESVTTGRLEDENRVARLATSSLGAIESLCWYRNEPTPVQRLISHTSGMPAVPMSEAHQLLFPTATATGEQPNDQSVPVGRPWRARIPQPAGGLSMVGGRLSSLMFRQSTLTKGEDGSEGEIALCLVTGTALDVVEHLGGKLKLTIVGSAIRGTTVTGHHGPTDVSETEIAITDCLLTETWFGEGLTGTATITGARVLHLTNLSWPNSVALDNGGTTGQQLIVTVKNSSYAHLANVRLPDAGQPERPSDVDRKSQLDELNWELTEPRRAINAQFASRMDYQSSPAQAEYERREDLKKQEGVKGQLTWPPFAPPVASRTT